MQAPSEALVLEEHQTGGPPFTHQHVCLCRSLSLYVCVHILIVTFNMYPNFDTTCFMQVAQDEYIASQPIPSHAEVDSQTRVLFEICF